MEKLPNEIYSESRFNELKQKVERIVDDLHERDLRDPNSHLSAEFQRLRSGRAKLMRGKYRGMDGHFSFEQYAMYYVLAGGSIGPDYDIRDEDFPGDDSVAHFVDKMEEYYS